MGRVLAYSPTLLVTLVAPVVSAELARSAGERRIRWEAREYLRGDHLQAGRRTAAPFPPCNALEAP